MNIKNIILLIAKYISAIVIALFILSLFTFFYKYTPEKIINFDKSTDFIYKPFGRISNYKEGFSTFYLDKNGFNNSHIKSTDNSPDILLMGSSHMFGSEISQTDNIGYLLNDMLSDYSVYNIGMGSHDLSICVKNLRDAINRYTPKEYVIIETSSVRIDKEIIEKTITGTLPHLNVYTNRLVGITQEIFPAIKRLLLDFQTWIDLDKSFFQEPYDSKNMDIEDLQESYRNYFSFIKEEMASSNIKLVFIYHPILSLDQYGEYDTDPDSELSLLFDRLCKENDFYFINMNNTFRMHYYNSKIFPHGFTNSEIGKGHLNRYGHLWMAEEITKLISNN